MYNTANLWVEPGADGGRLSGELVPDVGHQEAEEGEAKQECQNLEERENLGPVSHHDFILQRRLRRFRRRRHRRCCRCHLCRH